MSCRGGYDGPRYVPCGFVWTDSLVMGEWHYPHIELSGFRQLDGPVHGGWHYPHTVPCGFGRTDGQVRGDQDNPCSVPYGFGQTKGPVRGRWHCPRTVQFEGIPKLLKPDSPSARTCMARCAGSLDRAEQDRPSIQTWKAWSADSPVRSKLDCCPFEPVRHCARAVHRTNSDGRTVRFGGDGTGLLHSVP